MGDISKRLTTRLMAAIAVLALVWPGPAQATQKDGRGSPPFGDQVTTLSDLSCGADAAEISDGLGGWFCGEVDGVLGSLDCASGVIAMWNGTTRGCAADIDTDTPADSDDEFSAGSFLSQLDQAGYLLEGPR